MYRQVSARRPNSIDKGYKFLIIGRIIRLIFYVYTKVPNSAKMFDHKILDGCPWNVYCQSNSPGQGGWMLLNSSKTIVGMSWVYPLSRWCIALLYVYQFSSVIDFSEKYIVSTGHRHSWCQQRRNDEYIMMQYTIKINSVP